MSDFAGFLKAKVSSGGFTTEDALASFLPLAREVEDAHNSGWVAPLEGIKDLHVDGVQIWFEEARRRRPRNATADVIQAEQANPAGIEIVSETHVTTDVDHGTQTVVDLALGHEDQVVTHPVYLPNYRTWEHVIGCHDPLTDIFSLGMILASLACGRDFGDREELKVFVDNRKNIFSLAEKLHPVVARAIVRMSELDRRRRPQDLGSLIRTLEDYRDQEIDFEFDLARSGDFYGRRKRDKQTLVLTKLRERLFEISRRNRLLHFRPTLRSVNLTHASVPLSFDIKNIRPEQILTWHGEFQRNIIGGKRVSLNKYLNFSEALYLTGQLDRLISETRRDQSEFGFAQLRLAVCFFRWANLKETPVEQYDSPLLLLPVELRKKKGIRDTYYLTASASEIEINPVIRHQFKQLYDIDLPVAIDLSEEVLDEFFDGFVKKIEASDAGITVERIDRPRVQLIHEKARRQLDQYRRRARLSGRGIRKFMELDYSYDPANYHPLGITLFSAKVRPSPTRLRQILEERPRPRSFAADGPDKPVIEKERQFYAIQTGGEENPYDWKLDFCTVTLANFKYRRMSLVRDYEALLADGATNPAFDAAFSLSPKSVKSADTTVRPVVDRFEIVPCDPTQAQAVAEAASGKSYIIQGPPGTGKSQTITNLIADFVARGKRVLFVCEKRAAIDVVYARLRQRGLAKVCCLIHDSQTDKKKFVMDLKKTYETYLAEPDADTNPSDSRDHAVRRLKNAIKPLEKYHALMRSEPERVGTSVRRLLDHCLDLRKITPQLGPLAEERLPGHADWLRSHPAIHRFEEALRESGGGSVLAEHPLRILAPRLAGHVRPLELITEAAHEAAKHLRQCQQAFERSGLSPSYWQQLGRARPLVDHAQHLLPLVRAGQLALLDDQRAEADWFSDQLKQLKQLQRALDDAMESNAFWLDKLSIAETETAVAQAAAWEHSKFSWLAPSWWRLRGVMNRCYAFDRHKIRPTWLRILQLLELEHSARQERQIHLAGMAERLVINDASIEELIQAVGDTADWIQEQPEWLRELHGSLLHSPSAQETVNALCQADEALTKAEGLLAQLSDDTDLPAIDLLLESLETIVREPERAGDFVDCLRELQSVPEPVANALRSLACTPREIEAAVSHRSLADVWRENKQIDRFTAKHRRRQVEQLKEAYSDWLGANAGEVLQQVRARFLDNLHTANSSAGQLSTEQKEFKRRYNRGRRELEHEFGKQMRYKAIRDLVADESGDVVKDLKPVWLMSPLSVSDSLPLDADHFDVVIFDEASQITLEEAVPALFRASQSIIVGDQMQLPPTDFFSAKRSEEEEADLLVESAGELVQYDLDSGSFLNHAAKNLPSTMLGWHYRSRSESLISFSNWAFYEGGLLTVPEETLAGIERTPIVATSKKDGAEGGRETVARQISFHLVRHGIYEKRRNRAEAEYIAEMVRSLLQTESGNTIGIVAFSEAQQDEIELALSRLGQDDKPFRDRLEVEMEREEEGQFVGLLVKNLENIQGDERDIIILSICYGHPADGRMRMNFGPINKSGGEKRLNVAFSRAKKQMAVVSSIESADITNDYNDGANCLKNYLQYAQAVSVGDSATASRVLASLSRWRQEEQSNLAPSLLAQQISDFLTSQGYEVDHAVGQSHFRCDLAVYRDGDTEYRLGILIDTDEYYEQADLLERELMRPQLLRAFGWRIVHVLAKDWHQDQDSIEQQLVAMLEN